MKSVWVEIGGTPFPRSPWGVLSSRGRVRVFTPVSWGDGSLFDDVAETVMEACHEDVRKRLRACLRQTRHADSVTR